MESVSCPICLNPYSQIRHHAIGLCSELHHMCSECFQGFITNAHQRKFDNGELSQMMTNTKGISIRYTPRYSAYPTPPLISCPECREGTSINTGVNLFRKVPKRFIEQATSKPSGIGVQERQEASRKICDASNSITAELLTFRTQLDRMICDAKQGLTGLAEKEENQIRKLEEQIDKRTVFLKDTEANIERTGEHWKILKEKFDKKEREFTELEKEQQERLQANHDVMVAQFTREARAQALKDVRERIKEEISSHEQTMRETQEQVDARIKIRLEDCQIEIERKRCVFEANIDRLRKKIRDEETAKCMAEFKEIKDKFQIKIKEQKERLDAQMAEYNGSREDYKKFCEINQVTSTKTKTYWGGIAYISSLGEKQRQFWYMLDQYLSNENPKYRIEDYIKFRSEQQRAQAKGWKWKAYSPSAWLKSQTKHSGR